MRNVQQRGLSWKQLIALTACGLTILAAVIAATIGGSATANAAAYETAPAYRVIQEGLTPADGARIAEAFRIGNALLPNGAFAYVDGARYAQVPSTRVGSGKDEQGNQTVSEALDIRALGAIKPLADDEALRRAGTLVSLAGLSPDFKATPSVSHSELTISDRGGKLQSKHALDTAVSYKLVLGGLPATGQGAKLRITFAGDGSVTQLSNTLRKVERSADVPIIGQAAATAGCAALYGPNVRQLPPTLGYQLPALTATNASGKGSVKMLLPAYTCNPVGGTGAQAHRLLPAVPGSAPHAIVTATKSGATVAAKATVDGGTAPYAYEWSSSTTALAAEARSGASVKYSARPRLAKSTEVVSLEVTDANGMSATVSVALPSDGTQTGESVPGGGGFGLLAIGPTDVGIEQTVDEWQCAQDSAIGFKSVMASHAIPTAFDWRGFSAYEKDFKSSSLGGWDSNYVDNVDAQWYTGHGWSGGFTFKSNVDDGSIVPGDARWGNGDLEWMQLESCQVLRDVTGTADYFGRWGPTFDGLHMLNGFDTNAYCVGGGTGGTFAEYLFPKTFLWWELRPALTVRKAWANMALDREPTGVKYRSMGPIGSGWVTNMGDYFWGQGSAGPDIPASSIVGYWAISGTV